MQIPCPPRPMQLPLLPSLCKKLATPPLCRNWVEAASTSQSWSKKTNMKGVTCWWHEGKEGMRNAKCETSSFEDHGRDLLSCENLDDAITTSTDYPAPILTPDNGTDALSAHDAVAGDFLRATPSFKRPEAEASVVAGRNQLTTIGRKRQRGDGGRMGEHGVGTLTCAG